MGDNSMSMSMDESTLDYDNSVAMDPTIRMTVSPQRSGPRALEIPSITAGLRPNHTMTADSKITIPSSPFRMQPLSKEILEECAVWDLVEIRRSLRMAATELSRRGLKLASKWASEQLIGLEGSDDESGSVDENILDEMVGSTHMTHREVYAKSLFDLGEYLHAASILSAPIVAAATENEPEGRAKASVSHAYGRVATGAGVAKASSEMNGGDVVIHPPRPNLSSFGIFIRAYALYLAGEKRKEEEYVELSDPLERAALRNPYLDLLVLELGGYFNNHQLDVFGVYVYGVVLKELQKSPIGVVHILKTTVSRRTAAWTGSKSSPPAAHTVLISSILNFPYNWSAWLDIADLCINDTIVRSDVERLLAPLTNHWMYYFFCVHLFLEDQGNENALIFIDRLVQGVSSSDDAPSNNRVGLFTQSLYLQSQMAVAFYNLRDFDVSQSHFIAISQRDPLRLDHMDVFSNILYVKEDRVNLSQLAHRAVRIEKYRPETCCIVGNYYSIKSQHEKAVLYFQRALKLDRTYLSAWTLMGHEYIEMKNSAAAVEAYRRAVDINPRDYRAWYGLGQTYEIMNMLLYSLFYYKKAVELRPYDARMWCAMGGCYLALERRTDAIRCFERAVSNNDSEGIATRKLAELYREDGDLEQAARCYLRHLELRYRLQQPSHQLDVGVHLFEHVINSVNVDPPEAEALLFLATYYRDHGKYEMASMACSRLLDYPGPEKEEGKALLREMRSRLDSRNDSGFRLKTAKPPPIGSFDFSP